MSRNESFVRAARRLLAFQLAAAVGAAALTAWAVIEVRELVAERDRLAAQVAQIGRSEPANAVAPPVSGLVASEPPAAISPEPADAPPASPAPDPDSSPDPDGDVPDRAPPPPPPPPPGPRTACALLDGTGSECPLPWRRVSDGVCLDVQGRRARCPTGGSAPPVDGDETDPPPPARDCRSVEGRAIVCAPPYRATPVPGVCLDRNNRPLRCPPGQPPREPGSTATGATPTRTPTTTRPATSSTPRPSGTTRPRPSTSSTATPTRPRQPMSTAPTGQQPSTTTTAPTRTTRPVTTAPTTVRPAPVRRRLPPPPPESNQAQPR